MTRRVNKVDEVTIFARLSLVLSYDEILSGVIEGEEHRDGTVAV